LAELNKALTDKKISNYDAYKILDSNEDGFISYGEFYSGIDKIIKLTP
jgi:hypothetical protein